MFRIAKQIEISRNILICDNDAHIARWLQEIARELDNTTNINQFVCNFFLKRKSELSDEAIERLLAFGNTLSSSVAINTSTNVETSFKSNTKDKNSNSERKETLILSKLHKDVFNNIGSYLPIQSSLKLATTSHKFHQFVQNNEYFQHYSKGCQWKLDDTILKTACKYNCILQCFHKCTNVRLHVDSKQINCYNDFRYGRRRRDGSMKNCILKQIVNKIEKDKNHDLIWFKQIFGKIECLYVSNDWRCAFQDIPMSWLFDINYNYNYNNDETLSAAPLKVIGGLTDLGRKSKNRGVTTDLSQNASSLFTSRYQHYFVQKCQRDLSKVRKLKRLWIDWDDDVFSRLLELEGNFDGIMTQLPQDRVYSHKGVNTRFEFNSLRQFFQIFHSRVKWLEILIHSQTMWRNYNYFDILSSNNQDYTILDKIFPFSDDSTILIEDLEKTEAEMTFEQFLMRYKCESLKLPTIEQFKVHIGGLDDCKILLYILKHDKLMKLINLFNSVIDFSVAIDYNENLQQPLKQVLSIVIDNFQMIKKIRIRIGSNYTKGNATSIGLMVRNVFSDILSNLLVQCVISTKDKTIDMISITVGRGNKVFGGRNKVIIENNDELLNRNRNQLTEKINRITVQSCQRCQNLWISHKNDIILEREKLQEVFTFEKKYDL